MHNDDKKILLFAVQSTNIEIDAVYVAVPYHSFIFIHSFHHLMQRFVYLVEHMSSGKYHIPLLLLNVNWIALIFFIVSSEFKNPFFNKWPKQLKCYILPTGNIYLYLYQLFSVSNRKDGKEIKTSMCKLNPFYSCAN